MGWGGLGVCGRSEGRGVGAGGGGVWAAGSGCGVVKGRGVGRGCYGAPWEEGVGEGLG